MKPMTSGTRELPELRLERVRALLAVARHGGFSRAARALGRTQSSVSQAVAALEEDVGELLVARDGRTVRLTAAGRALADHGQRAVDALDDARGALAALRDVTAGALAVGASDTLTVHVLAPVLARFAAQHPGVELRLDNRPSPALAARVAGRALDLAVVSLPVRAAGVVVTALGPLPEVAICAPGHPLAARRRVTPAALAAHPLVLLDRTTAARAHLDAALARAAVRPRVALETSSLEVIRTLVAVGFGVAVAPRVAVAAEVARGELAARPLAGFGAARRVGVAVPAAGGLSRAARAFLEVLRATAGR